METELSGALIIDPPGAAVNDRVFVIGRRAAAPNVQRALTINGKSWPYTERFTFNEGDTPHWRWVNTSNAAHGMHLHGFYFHVDAVSDDGERVQPFRETDPPILVTQRIPTGGTFDMTLVAEHPGRWLFHCHMFAHMNAPPPPPGTSPAAAHDPVHGAVPGSAGMAGLVIGITVLPKQQASQPPAWKAERKLQLLMEDRNGARPAYRLEVRDPAKPAPPSETPATPQLLGPPIVLTQGQATEIEVINHTKQPTGIHWHGMELDSYYDGVPGWGGSGQQTAPAVLPGESFVARLAPLRSGSFIYHTHWHEPAQINNGVYGPLIVMPPGQNFDPATDLNFLFSRGTVEPFGLMLLINGHAQPLALQLKTGMKYRFRLTNITPNDVNLRVALRQLSGTPVKWRALAKDGADLPATAAILKPADQFVTVGETWDFEYQASEAQELALEIYLPGVAKLRTTQGLAFTAP
jgi:FtsP/CotA-like multicopper oxidase with cupredoxin domain